MKKFDRLLSYFYPISIETTQSKVNPFLEVVFSDGKYQLNSTNANYSYGGLYDLFKLVFRDIAIDWKKINNVLILGFGTGCTVPLIHQYKPNCRIVGIEKDEKVIDLGYKYFDIDKLANTSVVCDNALDFVNTTTLKFDLIIIDVYVDNVVPKEIETQSFLRNIKQILNNDGLVIFNKLMINNETKHQIPILKTIYKEVFGEVELLTLMQTGKIFVAKNT